MKYSALENELSDNDKYLSLGRSYNRNNYIQLLSSLRIWVFINDHSAIISEESTGKSIYNEINGFLLDISTL